MLQTLSDWLSTHRREVLIGQLEVAVVVLAGLSVGAIGVGIVALGAGIKMGYIVERHRRDRHRVATRLAEIPPLVEAAIDDLELRDRFVMVEQSGWTDSPFSARAGDPPHLAIGAWFQLAADDEAETRRNLRVVIAHELGHIELGHAGALTRLAVIDHATHRAVAAFAVLAASFLGLIPALIAFALVPTALFPVWSLLFGPAQRAHEYAADRYAVERCGRAAVAACLRHSWANETSSDRQMTALNASFMLDLGDEERDNFMRSVGLTSSPGQKLAALAAWEQHLDSLDPQWRTKLPSSPRRSLTEWWESATSPHLSFAQRLRAIGQSA